jgi:site-specific DNA-methyltransferase (adenine-specific)
MKVQEIETDRLKPWADNPRVNEHAVDAVARSISNFGFNVPILCDQDLTIVAGHTRWKAAKKIGLPSVPVIVLEMTDAQRRAFAIADNKTGEIARWDFPRLEQILTQLQSEKLDLCSLGYSDAELKALLAPPKDFDWAAFDKYRESFVQSTYVLLPVKVSIARKDQVKAAIRKRAGELGIASGDPAIAAGEVVAHLLGIAP